MPSVKRTPWIPTLQTLTVCIAGGGAKPVPSRRSRRHEGVCRNAEECKVIYESRLGTVDPLNLRIDTAHHR